MKRSVIRCMAISALAVAGNSAFAEENKSTENKEIKVADASNTTGGTLFSQEQIDFLKKEMQKKDVTENKITFAGLVQLNANFNDSQRSSAPDFTASKVHLGVNVSGGIASGQVEVQLAGNKSSTQTVSSTTSGGQTTQVTSGDNGNGEVTIRRAQLNLDVLTLKADQNVFTTTISLGGIRIGGGDTTAAPDTTWTPTGYGRQDGAYLKQALVFGKSANIELGFGGFNNIIAVTNNPYPSTNNQSGGYTGWGDASTTTKQANWGNNSFSQSMGIAGNIAATVNFEEDHFIKAKAYIGSQGNAPTDQDSNGNLTKAKDVTHIEASLLYNNAAVFGGKGVISGNGVSAWYENENIGRTKTATKSGGDFNYTNTATDDSQNATLAGLGIAADSSNYLTGMLQKGDFITYAISYAMANVTFGSKTTSQDYNVSQIAASIGYGVNTFETAINFEFDNSDTNVYADTNGTVNKKSATKTYLTMAYAF